MRLIRAIPARLWALAALSGLLQILPFPMAGPVPVWRTAFCWIALVPLLWVLVRGRDRDGRLLSVGQGAWLGYLCGFVWYMGNCYWIYQTMNLYGGLPPAIAFGILILFSLYLGLYHALFGALIAAFRASRMGVQGALWMVPFAWVATELARARITGFPWDLLGNSQVDNLLLTRLAPVGGVMAMSFVIVAVNALLASALTLRSRSRWITGVVGAMVAALIAQVGANLRIHAEPIRSADSAVLVQENLEVGALGKEVAQLSTAEMYRQFSVLSLNPESKSSDKNKPALIVWPEAPAGFLSSDPSFYPMLGELARASGTPVIAGSLGVDRDAASGRGYKLYDSAALIAADGSLQGRYDKIHLVPWGEYVPFKSLFFFAGKLTAGVGNMDPGTRRDVFRTGGHIYGVFICYESIFGDEVREFVKNGAEVLVNISDDGWYGDTGAPWQHLNMARMRAIENGRWVIRDTNTGVTTTIDPLGDLHVQAPRHVRGAYKMSFGYDSNLTFYTLHGDWFAYLCAVICVGGLVVWGFVTRSVT